MHRLELCHALHINGEKGSPRFLGLAQKMKSMAHRVEHTSFLLQNTCA